MARPAELVKQPDAVTSFREISSAAGNEQENVFHALWSFWNFEHAFDDILDSGIFPQDEREKLLHQCADYLHSCLKSPGVPDAVLWFKVNYVEALNKTGWSRDDRALAIKAFDDFTGNLISNPFYQAHAEQHLAIFEMMIFRVIAGDEMAASVDQDRQKLAPAVRCGDIDFLVHVAKLAGGWPLARKITSLRDYDKPD